MDDWEKLAQRNALLVHGLDWNERRAGIFEPAPTDELAVATTLGLVLNCLSSGLYMMRHIVLCQFCKKMQSDATTLAMSYQALSSTGCARMLAVGWSGADSQVA